MINKYITNNIKHKTNVISNIINEYFNSSGKEKSEEFNFTYNVNDGSWFNFFLLKIKFFNFYLLKL